MPFRGWWKSKTSNNNALFLKLRWEYSNLALLCIFTIVHKNFFWPILIFECQFHQFKMNLLLNTKTVFLVRLGTRFSVSFPYGSCFAWNELVPRLTRNTFVKILIAFFCKNFYLFESVFFCLFFQVGWLTKIEVILSWVKRLIKNKPNASPWKRIDKADKAALPHPFYDRFSAFHSTFYYLSWLAQSR